MILPTLRPPSPGRSDRRCPGTIAGAAIALLVLSVGACGPADPRDGEPPPPSKPAESESTVPAGRDVVLIVDGMEITAEEIHQFDESVARFHPAVGRSTLARHVLASHVLPLRASRRAFAAERAAAAAAAASYQGDIAGGGVDLLRETGATRGGYDAPRKAAGKLSLPLQRWAFALENLYAISPPLEVPEGFQVAATYEFHEAPNTGAEMVDVYVVPFLVQPRHEFDTWWREQQALLAGTCSWVHPRYRDALPSWMLPPPP